MINKHTYGGVVWIDLDSPTKDEIEQIVSEYGVSRVVAQELTAPSLKSRVEAYDTFVYLVIHFPVFKHSHTTETKQEIDFIIGKNFVITARYDTVDALYQFSKNIEVESILNKEIITNPRNVIFSGIMKEMYRSLENELSFTEDWLGSIEKKIFDDKEKDMVFEISKVGRNLLDFKKATDGHNEVLGALELVGGRLFGEDFTTSVKIAQNDYQKIKNSIKNNLELTSELRETNNSLLTTKQNEVVKVLTILAFITLPLSLASAIFQVDLGTGPILQTPNDLLILVGILAVISLAILTFFKYKKLL
ncbi:MAG: hypothetical protein HQ402_01885 [Parcubacteria group bacterium]|nr:hypothetical protein [Parcubacteria group bacterium]